jgi:TonB family protein
VWTLLNHELEGPPAPAIGRQGRRRWSLSLTVSVAAHLLVLVVWGVHLAPVFFVKPLLLARGKGGTATPVSAVLYLPKDLHSATLPAPSLLSLPSAAQKAQKKNAKLQKRTNVLQSEVPPDAAEAGSLRGSALDGPTEGDEVKQGFAIIFPPPRISRWELPRGIEGDVTVELTIDAQGNVVEEKLLQGLGHDIDERVIGILRVWRFRPATRNGVAIPFKYDARFHFPS